MIWIVGAGNMANEYVKVLKALGVEFLVIGRGEISSKALSEKENINVASGGVENFLSTKPDCPSHAIICTPVEALSAVTLSLIQFGVSSILVEKPGALNKEDLLELISEAKKAGAKVVIGYNRRFYQSVLKAEQYIEADGGLTAYNFEITEWSHCVVDAPSSLKVKEKWLLANTSHVIDLAFYLGGYPVHLAAFSAGQLDWHPEASRFVGAGVSDKGALLSYMGYWDGPGRWSVELITRKNRYILRPMERLSVQRVGSVVIEECNDIDYSIDREFKPGLYLQTKSFLDGAHKRFATLSEQYKAFSHYSKIASYNS